MKWTIRTILVLLAAFLLGGTQSAQAIDYTGCVTPGGTIVDLALGESPAKPCSNKESIIHLDDTNANQHVTAHFDLSALCKVLDDLTPPSADLEALGCPSDPLAVVDGTVQQVFTPSLSNPDGWDSFDENNETCEGMLKIAEDVDRWGEKNYHWQLTGEDMRGEDPSNPPPGGAYVARTHKILDGLDAPKDCQKLCEDDEQCIAAFYNNPLDSNYTERDCRIFHYSDSNRITMWNEYCGSGSPAICKEKIAETLIFWFLKANCMVY